MAAATEPVLDIERVLFLDARNRRFVEKTSPITARVRDAQESLWQFAGILAIAGGILFVAVITHVGDNRLGQSGRLTTGVILRKTQSSRICRVTYRFSGPPIYERTTDIAYELCAALTQGQAVDVLYNPQQPLYSNLKVAVEKPRYPVWAVIPFFFVVLVAIYGQSSKLRRERALCAASQVIFGSLVGKDVEMSRLTIRYRFRAPAGFEIRSEAEGPVKRSNWSYDSQFFPDKPDLVAVLFLNENEYGLL